MTNAAPTVRWRQKLFWRHYLLWSHRIDLFLSIIAIYLVVSVAAGILYVESMGRREAQLLTDVRNFQLIKDRFVSSIEVLKTRRLTNEEEEALNEIVLPSGEYSFYGTDAQRAFDQVRTYPGSRGADLLPFQAYFRFPGYARFEFRAIYSVSEAVAVAFLTSFVPLILMTFFVANVFQVRGSNYPNFALMSLLLACIAGLPVLTALLAQFLTNANYNDVFAKMSEGVSRDLPYSPEPSALDAFMRHQITINLPHPALGQDLTPETRVVVSGVPEPAFMAFAFIFWLSGAAWIIRRFGWNLFLICSAVVLTVLGGAFFILENIRLVASGPTMTPAVGRILVFTFFDSGLFALFLLAFVCYGLTYCMGQAIDWYREHTLCSSYLGVIIAVPILLFSAIGLRGEPKFWHVALMVAAIITVVFGIEIVLRWGIIRVLDKPR